MFITHKSPNKRRYFTGVILYKNLRLSLEDLLTVDRNNENFLMREQRINYYIQRKTRPVFDGRKLLGGDGRTKYFGKLKAKGPNGNLHRVIIASCCFSLFF